MNLLFKSPSLFKRSLGLKNKFRFIVAVFLSIIFAATAFVLVRNSNESVTKQVTDQAIAYADLSNKPLANNFELYFNSGYHKYKEDFRHLLSLNKNVTKIQIIDVNGFILSDSEDLDLITPPEKKKVEENYVLAAIEQTTPTYIYNGNNNQIKEIIYPVFDDWQGRRYTIRYFISYDQVLKNAAEVRNSIVIVAFLSLIISLLTISKLIDHSILNPIEKVYNGALLISQGKLDHEIKVETHDEVEDLANAVNKMARTLQKNIEALQQVDKLKDEFIAIASHNLRTPLTSIKGYLSLIEKGHVGDLTPKQIEYVHAVNQQVGQLDNLVEELLSVVNFESGNTSLIKTQGGIIEIAQEVIHSYEEMAAKKGVKLALIPPIQTVPQIIFDKVKITDVFRSLIDNAIKFSKPNTQVTVSFEIKDNAVITHVQDQGIGIDPNEIKSLFTKFHRGTGILTYTYPGEGLSLYITKLIISAHNGKIWVQSEPDKGSIFSFSLPLASEEPQNQIEQDQITQNQTSQIQSQPSETTPEQTPQSI